MSELEENMSAVVLWIRCTFVVLCIYAGAVLIAAGQMLRQWLSLKFLKLPRFSSSQQSSAAANEAPPAQAAARSKLPGSA